MKKQTIEMNQQIRQCTQVTENVRESMKKYRDQVLKIITNDRLESLLTLSESQIEGMSFAELRRSNHQS